MTTKNGDEDWHTPVLPKKFQNLANIDEYFLTADCLDVSFKHFHSHTAARMKSLQISPDLSGLCGLAASNVKT